MATEAAKEEKTPESTPIQRSCAPEGAAGRFACSTPEMGLTRAWRFGHTGRPAIGWELSW